MKTESTFYDHSGQFQWDWLWQMITTKNCYYFYDFKKGCFVRKVTHVKGEIKQDIKTGRKEFHPYPNKLVNYFQSI